MLKTDRQATISFFQCAALVPFFSIFIVGIFAVIVSSVSARTARRAFENKSVLSVLTKMREKDLQRQKDDQDKLLNSIFPKAIAQSLIENQAKRKEGGQEEMAVTTSSLGSSLACMHRKVTILFTDIVGFTSMSQTCQPFEVMSFLHSLFTAFDDLTEMDPRLWKVETIGDAFMVASGLGDMAEESSLQTLRLSASETTPERKTARDLSSKSACSSGGGTVVVSLTSSSQRTKKFRIREAFDDSLRATRARRNR